MNLNSPDDHRSTIGTQLDRCSNNTPSRVLHSKPPRVGSFQRRCKQHQKLPNSIEAVCPFTVEKRPRHWSLSHCWNNWVRQNNTMPTPPTTSNPKSNSHNCWGLIFEHKCKSISLWQKVARRTAKVCHHSYKQPGHSASSPLWDPPTKWPPKHSTVHPPTVALKTCGGLPDKHWTCSKKQYLNTTANATSA